MHDIAHVKCPLCGLLLLIKQHVRIYKCILYVVYGKFD